jgi:hypothetical protein
MNFCSIEDAWGDNKISSQFQKYKDDNTNRVCPNTTKIECPPKEKESNVIENFSQNINIITCDDILKHATQCKHCYNKLFYKFNIPRQNELINNLHYIINNNKDIIVLMLIGIFIVMFFKLINNITST